VGGTPHYACFLIVAIVLSPSNVQNVTTGLVKIYRLDIERASTIQEVHDILAFWL